MIRLLRFFGRRKALCYFVASLAMIGLIGIASSAQAVSDKPSSSMSQEYEPGNFILAAGPNGDQNELEKDQTYPTPAQVEQAVTGKNSQFSFSDGCQYLTFCRWSDVNSIPSPVIGLSNMGAAVGAGITMIGTFLFIVSSFVLYVMGYLLQLVVQINVLNNAAWSIDYIFGSVMPQILGMKQGNITAGTITLFALLILMTIGTGIYWASKRMGRRFGTRFIATGIMVAIGLALMSNQAEKNHSDLGGGSPIAAMGGPGGAIQNSPGSAQIAELDNWAPGSPGWIVIGSQRILDQIGGVLVEAVSSVKTAAHFAAGQGNNSCDRYIGAMHSTYKNIPAVKNHASDGDLMLAYDDLVNTAYFQNYQLAAYGDTDGARNSWCRIAEVQSGKGATDQAMLSRKADLYKELVGNKRLGHDGNAVAANGNWSAIGSVKFKEGVPHGYTQLKDFFGPYFLDKSSSYMFAGYFGACTWYEKNGYNAKLNPEWEGVERQGKDGKLSDKDCAQVLTSGKDGDKSAVLTEGKVSGVGFNWTASDGIVTSSTATSFAYHQDPNDVWVLLGLSSSGKNGADKFSNAKTFGGINYALDYYKHTQGMSVNWSVLYSSITLIMMIFLLRFLLPIVVGGIVAQAIGTGFLLFAPILFVPMIFPIPQVRKFTKGIGLAILAAFGVNAFHVAVMQAGFTLGDFIKTMLYDKSSPTIVKAIISAFAIFIGFKAIAELFKKATGDNFKSMRQSAISSAVFSLAPASNVMGKMRPQFFVNLKQQSEVERQGPVDRRVKEYMNDSKEKVKDSISDLIKNKKDQLKNRGNPGTNAEEKSNGKALGKLLPGGHEAKDASANSIRKAGAEYKDANPKEKSSLPDLESLKNSTRLVDELSPSLVVDPDSNIHRDDLLSGKLNTDRLQNLSDTAPGGSGDKQTKPLNNDEKLGMAQDFSSFNATHPADKSSLNDPFVRAATMSDMSRNFGHEDFDRLAPNQQDEYLRNLYIMMGGGFGSSGNTSLNPGTGMGGMPDAPVRYPDDLVPSNLSVPDSSAYDIPLSAADEIRSRAADMNIELESIPGYDPGVMRAWDNFREWSNNDQDPSTWSPTSRFLYRKHEDDMRNMYNYVMHPEEYNEDLLDSGVGLIGALPDALDPDEIRTEEEAAAAWFTTPLSESNDPAIPDDDFLITQDSEQSDAERSRRQEILRDLLN